MRHLLQQLGGEEITDAGLIFLPGTTSFASKCGR